jgi:hypothetical protein
MLNRSVGLALIVLCASAAAITGCTDRELKPLNPCQISNVTEDINPEGVSQVDLLFLVDSSASMQAEQNALAAEVPSLMEVLSAGNPPEGEPGHIEGLPAFEPVDMHVGVTTVDMGLLDADIAQIYAEGGLNCDQYGDDGILHVEGNATGCTPTSTLDESGGRFLRFDPNETDTAAFNADFACLSATGVDGCFLEQQLEASLKAVTPSNSELKFHNDRDGQGNPDGPNAGFLRPGSLLAVILVTDEDDCSMADPSIHANPAPTATWPGSLNPRCFIDRNSDAVHPVQRYAQGFAALRDDPSLVIYSMITGIPVGMTRDEDGDETLQAFYDRVLAHPDMELQLLRPGPICISGDCNAEGDGCLDDDPDVCTTRDQDFDSPSTPPTPAADLTTEELNGGQYTTVLPACIRDIPGEPLPGIADPARRLVGAAKAMDAVGIQTLVSSICKVDPENPANLDFSDAIDDLLKIIARSLPGACLPRALNPRPDGSVPCDVLEVQPLGVTECDASRGRVATEPPRTEGEGEGERIICAINQVLPEGTSLPSEPGWFYDYESDENPNGFFLAECPPERPQRISFVPGFEPTVGTQVRLECLQNVAGADTLGGPCGAGSCNIPQFADAICNTLTNTCMLPCSGTADCRAAGLQAHVCDSERPDAPTFGFCVDPKCQ